MRRFWWLLGALAALACASQPSFPDGLGSAGASSAGAAGRGGGDCGGPEVAAECVEWAACDPCAQECGCDGGCVVDCQRRLYGAMTSDLLMLPHDPVRLCSAEFVSCFAEPLGGIDGAGNCQQLQACCGNQRGGSDSVYCQALADDGDEGACLLARYRYFRDGACSFCDDPAQVAPECENWALCDPCASACACDHDCVEGCQGTLFGNYATREQLLQCSDAIIECFAPAEDAPQYCEELEPCCDYFAESDDGPLCRGVVATGKEGACLAMHQAYSQSGACP